MWKTMIAYRILVRKFVRKGEFERPGRRLENNTNGMRER
jgi:hypothetical protein